MSPVGAGAPAAQPAEAHLAAGQRPVPGVAEASHEGHAAHRERPLLGAAAPGGGDEEEGPGTNAGALPVATLALGSDCSIRFGFGDANAAVVFGCNGVNYICMEIGWQLSEVI